jgi:hypothetical protein
MTGGEPMEAARAEAERLHEAAMVTWDLTDRTNF